MARLIVFAALVLAGVAGALFLISERSALTAAGYRVAQLEAERRRLVEANRKLEAQIAAARAPGTLAERVKALQIDLVSPEQHLEQELARAKEAERARAADASHRARAGR